MRKDKSGLLNRISTGAKKLAVGGALGIASLIIILDPELVVINGEIVELGQDFLDLLKDEVGKIIPYKRDVVFSSLRNRSKIYGGIKNGLDYIDSIIFREPQSFYNFSVE